MYSELIDQKIHTRNEKYCLDRFISTCTTVSMLFSKLLSVYTFPLGIFFSEIYLIINKLNEKADRNNLLSNLVLQTSF